MHHLLLNMKKVIKVVIDVASVQAYFLTDGPAGTGYQRALPSILGQTINFHRVREYLFIFMNRFIAQMYCGGIPGI